MEIIEWYLCITNKAATCSASSQLIVIFVWPSIERTRYTKSSRLPAAKKSSNPTTFSKA